MKKTISLLLALVLCLSLCACGASGKANPSDAFMDSGNTASQDDNNEMIEFENTIVADDMDVTIELVNFHTKEYDWVEGKQQEKIVTFRFTNKTDQQLFLNADNFYLDNEKAYVCMEDGTVSLEAGRAGKYSFIVAENTSPEHTALRSLDELYKLEGTFSGYTKYGDSHKDLEISFSISKAMNGEVTAMASPDLEKYGEVVAALEKNVWYFNGGADNVMNAITFSESAATISQVSYDGNGKHEGAVNAYPYTLDDNTITVTLADGSPLEIPYTRSGDSVILDGGRYMAPDDIVSGLQGFWTLENNGSIHYVHIEGNTITSEKASAAANGASGDYYWYGGEGYSASYQLNFGGFDTTMRHGKEWFFNVIDGKATLIHYDKVCSPAEITELPGEKGYSFK